MVTLVLAACGDDELRGGAGWSAPAADLPATCDDTSSDPFHCGACGHTCWGGECVEGVCQANLLTFTPSVIVDDIALGGGARGGPAPTASRLATYFKLEAPIAEMSDDVTERRYAIDGGMAYWTGADGIYRCPLDNACANHPEHVFSETLPPGQENNQLAYAYGFTVENGEAFVIRAQGLFGAPRSIETCAIDNCASLTTIYSVPAPTYIMNVLSDGTNLAWFQDVAVWTCTARNCQATAHEVAANALMPNPREFPLVLENGTLVWNELTLPSYPYKPRVMTCQLPACTPTPLLDVSDAVYTLSLHAGRVYVNAQNGIVSVPLTGGAAEPVPVKPYNVKFYASDAFYVLGTERWAR